MPSETDRITRMKRIYNPDNASQFVDIPIIDRISFTDPFDRYQETQHTILNNETGNRDTHVVDVISTDTPPDHVMVERIDVYKVVDPFERYQETQMQIDNVTGEETSPPHFTSHLKTHLKRVNGTGDNSTCYIDVERIDQLRVTDPFERYQETIYELSSWEDEQQ